MQIQKTNNYLLEQNNMVTSSMNDNKVLESSEVPNNEADLKIAYIRHTEELRLIKRQLANSQMRVKELEEQIRMYQQKGL